MTERSLAQLIERGGVYHGIKGSNPRDFLTCLIQSLPEFPGLNQDALLRAFLEREALMPTVIGCGIAVPHPRSPLLGEGDPPFVALGFPVSPIDWNTQDSSMVHAVFLLVSVSAQQHLAALSKINFLCQQEKIQSLVAAQASGEKIISTVRQAEKAWAEK